MSALEKLCEEVMRLKAEGTPKNPPSVRFEEMEACSAALKVYWEAAPKLAQICQLQAEALKECMAIYKKQNEQNRIGANEFVLLTKWTEATKKAEEIAKGNL
jgi:hypothetical protein